MSEGLEGRLRRLEDERAITNTLYTYGHTLDYDDEEGFLDCWTEDALLVWPGPGELKGRAAIAAGFRAHTHAPAFYHKHLVIAPLIRIDGDRATVDSMFVRVDPYDGLPGVRAFGRYRDVLVRCEDGRWRIKERRPEIEAFRKGDVPAAASARMA